MNTPPDHARPGRSPHRDVNEAATFVCARCQRPLRLPVRNRPVPPDSRGRVLVAVRRWPEGWICGGCYSKARETYGVCPGCGVDRLLPGLTQDGAACCTDCAGGIGDFTCTRCGNEGSNEYRGVCGRCVLGDRLAAHLDDGTGQIRPELVAFYDRIVAMHRPRVGILWLSKPHVPPILRALARGDVPLTHDGLSHLSPLKSVVHVRDLLIESGVLPPVDRHLVLFEQWLPKWLDQITDPAQRKILQTYATWSVLHRLRSAADNGPVGHYRDQNARHRLRVAAAFLEHLASCGVDLPGCGQADLDRWFANAADARKRASRPFLVWAIRTKRMQQLRLPPTREPVPKPISLRHRVELLRRIHAGDGMDLTERVIAMLILLYAQPLNRITRLTLDDISVDEDGQMLIRLGDPPAPVPAIFAAIITDYLAARPNLTTATNKNSTWLFPGRRAGQPLHPTSIRLRLSNLDIPNMPGRSRALREMLLQAPPAVVAGMLGYHTGKSEAIAAQAGTAYKRYAVGDHSRTRNPRLSR
ncbi:hypothetical protein ATK17_3779 [Branchiibius hedensis]|uniref:Site-specific recombinase XerD n=1 Tax=Branchiibius hedensis TaxID=672460 RepID=A0A2Y9C6W8_9MICO|nr:hypothetical protein ATK17_3779 [Branchiibius hedensis]SSA58975.1 hypothetical protein SAMN04489750_3779 [Branchiibius hedensis]